MPSELLSAHARRFLAEDVESVMQLELVLRLHGDARTAWTPTALAQDLRAPEPWVADQLATLVAAGVLEPHGEDETFRFRADGPAAASVAEVAALYPQRRTSIIRLIFDASARPSSG